MSAGPFTNTFYTSNANFVHPIRVQPETLSLSIGGQANSAPTGPANAGTGFVRISGSKRTYGITPRKVAIRFTGTPPTGYSVNQIYRIPVLIPGHYQAYVEPKLQTGTYLGVACQVVGKSEETGRG
jgi:hypothetical protein